MSGTRWFLDVGDEEEPDENDSESHSSWDEDGSEDEPSEELEDPLGRGAERGKAHYVVRDDDLDRRFMSDDIAAATPVYQRLAQLSSDEVRLLLGDLLSALTEPCRLSLRSCRNCLPQIRSSYSLFSRASAGWSISSPR